MYPAAPAGSSLLGRTIVNRHDRHSVSPEPAGNNQLQRADAALAHATPVARSPTSSWWRARSIAIQRRSGRKPTAEPHCKQTVLSRNSRFAHVGHCHEPALGSSITIDRSMGRAAWARALVQTRPAVSRGLLLGAVCCCAALGGGVGEASQVERVVVGALAAQKRLILCDRGRVDRAR